ANGFAGARTAAAAVVAQAVLGIEGEVGVAGAILVLDVRVVLAVLIGVAKQDADRGAVGLALEDARPDLGNVLLLALRDDLRLAGAAPPQIGQQVVDAEREAGRTAVDDAHVPRPMTDAGGGDAKQFSEGIARHDLVAPGEGSHLIMFEARLLR